MCHPWRRFEAFPIGWCGCGPGFLWWATPDREAVKEALQDCKQELERELERVSRRLEEMEER